MRPAALLILLPLLLATPARATGTLFTNDLALQCSSQEPHKRLVCEAYVGGYLAGLAVSGLACPVPESSREIIEALLAIPQEQLGTLEAAVALGRLTATKYPCN
jgi:hypothetical protein